MVSGGVYPAHRPTGAEESRHAIRTRIGCREPALRGGAEMLPTFDGTERGATSIWWADMLGRKTGEAVWIGVLMGDRVHIVHQAGRPEDRTHDLGGDGALPWYACALGQSILARLGDACCQ